jgi:hypothetical protein
MRPRLVPAIAAAATVLALLGLAVVVVRSQSADQVVTTVPGYLTGGGVPATDLTAPSTGQTVEGAVPPPAVPTPPVEATPPVTPSDLVVARLSPPAQVAGPEGTVRIEPYPSAQALAADLTIAETLIRSDDATPDELAAAGLVQQIAIRELGLNPEWVDVIRTLVPDDLRVAVEANLSAQGELVALTPAQEDLPSWTIEPPPPADELVALYQATAADFGMDWTYLAAIHLVETRMGRIRGTSSAGAQGPMQFIPPTWDIYGEGDINDTGDAVRAAARYLTDRGAPDDMDRALFAYNNSERYVRSVQSYAEVIRADPRTYRGYHGWQVFYRLASGTVLLPEGWSGS